MSNCMIWTKLSTKAVVNNMMKKHKAFTNSDAFAVFSMPRSLHHTVVWSDDGFLMQEDMDVPSFVVQSFNNYDFAPTFIPANHVAYDIDFSFEGSERCKEHSTTEEEYLMSARETIEAIRRNDFAKVVISKIKRLPRGRKSVFEIFNELKNKHVNTFVFLYHIPGRGLWCGATPEVLLRDKGSNLHTMALAGTMADMGVPISNVKWREKESHEQHVIETFIEGRLEDEGLQYSKRGPRTVRAGAMLHICTDYYMKDNRNGLKIAALLHPGPAICGLPQSLAKEWIGTYEDHDRRDYCGYIGPWRIPGRNLDSGKYSALYINLRSMTIWKDAFVLYLGGGLTAMSEARSEWDETELKASTMMSVIGEKTPV